MNVKISREITGELLYGGLVVLAVIVLPMLLLQYGGHYGHAHSGKVINIVGYNPPGENNAYWAVHNGNVWRYGRKSDNVILVKEGDAITLHVTSFDSVHGFSIPEYDIDKRIYPGRVTTINFKAEKAGKFAYFCSIYCSDPDHWKMSGELIVEK